MTPEESLQRQIQRLGPWFHNFHLPGGLQTAPDHFLGDFPSFKWNQIRRLVPRDLHGWSVLDIGCNAGFYSFELARRGARVLGIDSDPHYLWQARWLARVLPLEKPPEFVQMQVHDLARIKEAFDLVLFMGVFYHLRYPQLALDSVAMRVRRMMIFQSLSMSGESVVRPGRDYPISERKIFSQPGWPKMAFVEERFAGDPTNWWVPNHAAIEALLRSAGFSSVRKTAHEIYVCRVPRGGVSSRRQWDLDEWQSATGIGKAGRQRRAA